MRKLALVASMMGLALAVTTPAVLAESEAQNLPLQVAPAGDANTALTTLLLKLSNDKLCDPESEMYCEAHTVFVKDGYAIVLASVQPTAGLFQLYQQTSSEDPQTAKTWALKGTYQQLDYETEIEAAQISNDLKDFFKQAFQKYIEKQRQQSN